VRRVTTKEMIQKEQSIIFRHVKREWLADQSSARAPEKLGRGEVNLFDSTDTVETDIRDWCELEKIDVALNCRFQFRLGMLEDWHVRRSLCRAIFPNRPIRRKFPGGMRGSLHVFISTRVNSRSTRPADVAILLQRLGRGFLFLRRALFRTVRRFRGIALFLPKSNLYSADWSAI